MVRERVLGTGADQEVPRDQPVWSLRRIGFVVLGGLMLALGLVGAFLPIMPTTIFLILAAWCFGRSSPRLEAWMLDHPSFGSVLRSWREHRAIPRTAKFMACSGMFAGYTLLWFGAKPDIWVASLVAVLMSGCALYILTRPTGR